MMIANRYEPTGKMTAGGMGEIIECRDSHLRRPVIIKRLQSGIDERRIVDEQKALAKLRSKHVVQLYDIVELADRGRKEKAIVLEYIEGDNLEVGSLEPNLHYVKILWQIACGLRDIHRAGIIHRDIKPNNIRLDGEGVVKILDFGLARDAGFDAKTRSIIGTPIFMAPELWGTETISFNSSIDVYAFGVTALALMNGTVLDPLGKQPPQAVPLTSLENAMAGVAPDIVEVVHRCLSMDPRRRPDMETVQKSLAGHLLRDEHRALVVMDGRHHHLNKRSRRITLNAPGVASLIIEYDGMRFSVTASAGSVFLNNSIANKGDVVPGCCVITFGASGNRRFVTFDVSNPEVMP
ncbi:serine/threonine protein kinase [Mesorhizobium sp. M1227]|uniref:serine/threonine-protein kinase n=1 Tax=Mesorhizobium sp. M1227 TaxID=2957071 RepID=UPI00333B9276